MEASEKPQLALDDTSVRVLDDRLVIERLTVTDDRAARVVRERAEAGHEPAQTIRDAVEIGARVLEREGTAAEVDYVRAEFERHAAELRERLSQSIADGDEALAERIAGSFDGARDGSVQQQVRAILDRALEEQRTKLVGLFSAEDGANPLTDFKGSVVRELRSLEERRRAEAEANRRRIEELTLEITELRKEGEADVRVAAAEEAGTRKGFSFEERVHAAVERIASARGDAASHTGAEAAEGGGKKGDTLVELGAADGPAAGRILFEAKDKRLSRNDAWAELNDGMAARAARFGVLVVAGEDRLPARTQTLCEYEGNKLVVAVDRDEPDGPWLELAYRLAAARIAMARDRDLQVDAVAVRDTAEEAISILKHAQAIRSTLTGIKTSSDRARASLDTLVEAVRAKLERIDSLVGESGDD